MTTLGFSRHKLKQFLRWRFAAENLGFWQGRPSG